MEKMSLDGHILVQESTRKFLSSIEEKGRPSALWIKQEHLDGDSSKVLYPYQRYDYCISFWTQEIVNIILKLEEILDMLNRNIYSKKSDDRGELIERWTLYNYEFHILTYESILDVCLLLTNEVFALGIPYRNCSLDNICKNRLIRGTDVKQALYEINRISDTHRKERDFLLHRGQGIKSHPGMSFHVSLIDEDYIAALAEKTGGSVQNTKKLVRAFASKLDRRLLIPTIQKESADIEIKVGQLFDALLPYYRKFRPFHSQ
jgi:hypothetical protein